MKCPFCGFLEDKVVDSRESKEAESIRRRRECLKCGKRYTTYERIDEIPYMIVLFTSIFTMMSVIEDRKEGFLLSVMVAPVPRSAIVLGKVLGGTTLAAAQGLIFLIFAPFIGIHFGFTTFLLVVLVVFLVSFALTALGFAIAWPMDSTSAFHAIIKIGRAHV